MTAVKDNHTGHLGLPPTNGEQLKSPSRHMRRQSQKIPVSQTNNVKMKFKDYGHQLVYNDYEFYQSKMQPVDYNSNLLNIPMSTPNKVIKEPNSGAPAGVSFEEKKKQAHLILSSLTSSPNSVKKPLNKNYNRTSFEIKLNSMH